MKFEILNANTRCPYCGELAILPIKLSRYGAMREKCRTCGGEYVFQFSPWSVFLWGFLGMTVNSCTTILTDFYMLPKAIDYGIIFLWVICNPVIWTYYPLKPVEPIKWGLYSNYDVKIEINRRDRGYFKLNMIYPICFIDENNRSVSKYSCVKVTEIRKKKNEYYCVISTLPFGEQIDESFLGYKFDIFFDKRIIGTGKIIQVKEE